jgi:ribosome-associated protein
MLQVSPKISIPRSELTINFVRSSGPGGQNVNKVATAVQLRFNIRTTSSLSEEIKSRLGKLAGHKMTKDGELVIEAKRHRLQEQNRVDAEQRLVSLIQKALLKPKKRRPTHPTLASQVKRVETKKLRGKTKSLRKIIDE